MVYGSDGQPISLRSAYMIRLPDAPQLQRIGQTNGFVARTLFLIRDKRWIVMSDWLTITILSIADVVVLVAVAVFTISVLL